MHRFQTEPEVDLSLQGQVDALNKKISELKSDTATSQSQMKEVSYNKKLFLLFRY